MYHTPGGDRILLGAERRFFTQLLAMVVDLLAEGDMEFGVIPFDELQRNQKLLALYKSARGLLRPNEPAPKLVAFIESAVAIVYEHAKEQVYQEIDEPDASAETSFWRRLVLDAVSEQVARRNCRTIRIVTRKRGPFWSSASPDVCFGTMTTNLKKAWIFLRRRVESFARYSVWPTTITRTSHLIRPTIKQTCTSTP